MVTLPKGGIVQSVNKPKDQLSDITNIQQCLRSFVQCGFDWTLGHRSSRASIHSGHETPFEAGRGKSSHSMGSPTQIEV
eukprot:12904646-Prorocentrum_lima.AAC.1